MEIYLSNWHFQLSAVALSQSFFQICRLSWKKKLFCTFYCELPFWGWKRPKTMKNPKFWKKLKICGRCKIHRFWFFWGQTVFLGQNIPEVTANSSSDPWGEKKGAYRRSKVRKTAKIDHPSFGASWRLKGAKKKEKKRSTFLFMIHPNI